MQHRKSEREKAAEEADNLLDKAGRKVKQGANWFGNKADDVGSKAGESPQYEYPAPFIPFPSSCHRARAFSNPSLRPPGEITEEHIQPAVSAATDQVVSAAGSVKETVSDATQGIRAKASTAGSPPPPPLPARDPMPACMLRTRVPSSDPPFLRTP